MITDSGVWVCDREIDGLRVACGVPALCSSLAGTPRPCRTNLLLVCLLLRQRSPPPHFSLRGCLSHFQVFFFSSFFFIACYGVTGVFQASHSRSHAAVVAGSAHIRHEHSAHGREWWWFPAAHPRPLAVEAALGQDWCKSLDSSVSGLTGPGPVGVDRGDESVCTFSMCPLDLACPPPPCPSATVRETR